MAGRTELHGIFPPIPTPFGESGEIDFHRLESNLARWDSEPLDGYVVGGSNGEFISLSTEERVELVRFVSQHAQADRVVIAGTGMPSTRATIELGSQMSEAGAAAFLVVAPSYYQSKMGNEALLDFYRTVADASPLPVLIYNVPAFTGIDMEVETICALSRHARIVGIKDSSGRVDKVGAIVQGTPADFVVLAGSGGFFLGALAMGAVGLVAALANFAASQLRQVLDAFERGDVAAAREIQLPLIQVNKAVTARFGVAGLKSAMDLLGYYGGPVRAPLLDLGEEQRVEVERLLRAAELL